MRVNPIESGFVSRENIAAFFCNENIENLCEEEIECCITKNHFLEVLFLSLVGEE